ncbi:MAG: DUF3147 family protein [Halanaerobium sp.]|nr:DUF3147 family protein [Halanaerobium sp.]
MFYTVIKTIISAVIIVAISEIAKRSSLLGAILASLPLVSFLGMIWLYIDTKSVERVAQLSSSIFWMVIPSLSLFIILPVLLRHDINFYLSLAVSTTVMVLIYFIMLAVLKRFGIEI